MAKECEIVNPDNRLYPLLINIPSTCKSDFAAKTLFV